MLDQKKAYALTYPPTFDVDDKSVNDKIVDVLGDDYERISKQLCVNAGSAGIAWLHVWKDAGDNSFRYACVDSKEVIPIYSKSLDKKLVGVLRVYSSIDETDGKNYTVYEYWNDKECSFYRHEKEKPLEELEPFQAIFLIDTMNGDQSSDNSFKHDFGLVPFIPFKNNEIETNDLKPIKDLVDVYDKVFSGFVNDTDDVQEVIFVLTNYGGQDKQEFLEDLKRYKMIKMDNVGMGDQSGVTTIAIDIPTEARNLILERTK
ncbi:phage portal protein, partial [Listeria monocytogenes]|uniref:phage portal protein n=1 Tax=Listeria monocytogenes TaxID=1639 RepID=UPI001F546B80